MDFNLYRWTRNLKNMDKFLFRELPVLDLGYAHDYSLDLNLLKDWNIQNTSIDLNKQIIEVNSVTQIISFEVFEHLLNPYNVLKQLKGRMLITVPLNLWWRKSHWLEDDLKQHYHEFEVRQFNKLLDKTGWRIFYSELWKIGLWDFIKSPGIRTFPRLFWPSFYFVVVDKGEQKC